MASSKLFFDDDVISMTFATLMALSFFFASAKLYSLPEIGSRRVTVQPAPASVNRNRSHVQFRENKWEVPRRDASVRV
jgi:hypothetical protein